jgi:hypothetical protein
VRTFPWTEKITSYFQEHFDMDGGEIDVPLLVSELRVLQYTYYLQNYTPAKRRCPLFVYIFLFHDTSYT